MANLDKTYITLDQASVRYATSIETLRRWARDGKLPCFRIGRKYLIEVSEMEHFMESRRSQRKGVSDGQA